MKRKEIKSQWISVQERLPAEGRNVATKIESETLGTWCLLTRRYDKGRWSTNYPAPTHWHE